MMRMAGVVVVLVGLVSLPVMGEGMGQRAVDTCETAPQTCATVIETRAEAHTRLANTAVDVTVGVSATKAAMALTQRELAERSGQLMGYLRGQGAERMSTTQVSVSADTKPQKNGPDRTVSYTGTTRVRFRTTPEKAPAVLAGVLENGGSSIDGTSFQPREEEVAAARRAMAAEATKTAMAEVESVAMAAGLRVLAVRRLTVGEGSMPQPVMRTFERAPMMAMQAAPAPPIETAAGEQEVSVTVGISAAAGR